MGEEEREEMKLYEASMGKRSIEVRKAGIEWMVGGAVAERYGRREGVEERGGFVR